MIGLTLSVNVICSVCRREHDSAQADEDRAVIALVGVANQYAVCPCCQRIQQHGAETNTGYRRRVRAWLKHES